ncbi:hypothetical protein V6N13_038680 [Hibiscus sabdariffa]
MLSIQSDSSFPLVIVSPEGQNRVGTSVADEPCVGTGLGLIEVNAPAIDGSCGVTRPVSTEQRCSDDLSLESQEVRVGPEMCLGSGLDSMRVLGADPESSSGPSLAPDIIENIVSVSSPVAGDQAEPHISNQFHSIAVVNSEPVCEANPTGSFDLGIVSTSSSHDSLREELEEACLHNDVQSDLGFPSVLAPVALPEVHGSRTSEIDCCSSFC